MADLAPDEAVIQAMYLTLANDTPLQTIMGGNVDLYSNYAPQDPDMPYLVHRLNTDKLDTGRRNGDYYVDWWDYSGSQSTVWKIERRLFILLDEGRFLTNEAGLVRISNELCNPIPETNLSVQHYTSRWNVRYFAKELVGEINLR